MAHIFFRALLISLLVLLLAIIPHSIFPQDQQTEDEEKTEVKEPRTITEEILVVGDTPKDRPISTVTTLDKRQIESAKPLDISEAIRYAPGVTVTFGDKSVYTLKLRGVDSRRIALLIDGVPVYEPYFSTFDLKTVSADGIDSLKITRGPSSVLYGPNTLGGIVNVITQRPTEKPKLSFHAAYGELDTRSIGLQSSFQVNRWAFAGNLLHQHSDGFYFPDEANNERQRRHNTDYQRFNFNGKVYFTPSNSTEILFNAGIYLSDYAMPPEINAISPRYWRFQKWNRYSLNAGGYSALGEKSLIRYRAYYVHYDNVLNMFDDPELTQVRFESTHDNSVVGVFALADLYLSSKNQLKLSVDYKTDKARIQDDLGEPWNEFDQSTVSLAVEEHLSFFENWVLVAGLSLDYLDKFTGENTSRLNPLLGIKNSPSPQLDFHLSFSKKSRFPSMRSLYSASSGNPELLSEIGILWELGFTYNNHFLLTGAIFLSRLKDMIDSVRLPQFEFQRVYFNIGKARIDGLELQFQKEFRRAALTFNYTFLDHWNQTDNRPLTVLPKHNANFDCQISINKYFRFGVFGMLASSSYWLDFNTNETLDIPSYFNLDAVLAYRWDQFEFFVKITNIFDNFIYTELGFPWRGRYFELGFSASLFK